MIAPEEMAQLRVRLADLPGFDATGLILRDDDGSQQGLVVYDDGRDVLVHPEDGDGEPAYWTKDQDSKPHTRGDEEPHVSTADARTRDALARWVAERVKVTCRATAPEWRAAEDMRGTRLASPSDIRHGWVLHGYGGAWFWRDSDARVPPGKLEFVVPGLSDLDPGDAGDDRRLPDGSRWVDAAALAAVARHVGGQP